MDTLTATAASGMRSRIETLDLLANNLANSGTSGYKADQESYNLYFGADAWKGYNEGRDAASEMPVIQKSWTDLSQGTLVPTGNQGDLALTSKGFFVLQTDSAKLYTRGGNFQVSKQGQLETQDGYKVLNTSGKPISLDGSQPFTVAPNGSITQAGSTVATIQIVNVDQVDALTKRNGTYFTLGASAKATPSTDTAVVQGKVEMSNVPGAEAAVKLVGVMRQFEMLQRAVRLASDMNRQAVEQVAKVG